MIRWALGGVAMRFFEKRGERKKTEKSAFFVIILVIVYTPKRALFL